MHVALVIFYADSQDMYKRTLTWKQIGHSTMALHVFFSNEKHHLGVSIRISVLGSCCVEVGIFS